ncbi:MAG: nucleotidyltransferase domain-containing protein [Rhodospirillaceae bacterium]|nr:nucleotidyltransferase domain-containing protein [Rhodospirillaceae bacterium]
MANTPVMSLRVAPKHRPLVRRAARALRDQPRLAAQLAGLLGGKPAVLEPALGPFRDQEAALGFIRDRLVACLKPEEVWLFGSRARGNARPDSDFDILVVLPDDAQLDYQRVYEPLMASGLGCDVVPCRKSDFRAEALEPGTMSARVVTEGRLLYRRRPR